MTALDRGEQFSLSRRRDEPRLVLVRPRFTRPVPGEVGWKSRYVRVVSYGSREAPGVKIVRGSVRSGTSTLLTNTLTFSALYFEN